MPGRTMPRAVSVAARAILVVFGIVFGGVGLAVIGFLWARSGFGESPTFFKVFGTLVALPFIAFGAMFLIGGLGLAKFARAIRRIAGGAAQRIEAGVAQCARRKCQPADELRLPRTAAHRSGSHQTHRPPAT